MQYNTIIYITNQAKIEKLYRRYGLLPAEPMKLLVASILHKFAGKDLKIVIYPKLLPASYQSNPQLFVRVLPFTTHTFIQGFMENDDVIIHAASAHHPTTFFQEAIEAIKAVGKFRALKGRIPGSYLTQPTLFSHFLRKRFAKSKFAIIAKSRSITWKRIDIDKST